MQIKLTTPLLVLALSAFAFMGCDGYHTRIHSLNMTIAEAPEVHGANTSQSAHSASWRFTGKVNSNSREDVTKTVKGTSYASDNTKVTYKLGGTDFSAKADFLYKLDGFTFGTGAGFKDGLYHHFTLGANLQYFEFGFFFGFFHQYNNVKYVGSKCQYIYHLFTETEEDCQSFSDDRDIITTSPFMGSYAGIMIDNFFINYSVGVYKPSVDIEKSSLDLAIITTQYITIGYRINRRIELSLGAVINYMDIPHWNYGFTGGLSFYAM